MRKLKTQRWDPVDSLDTDERMIGYLDAALENGDPELVTAVLGDIARAKGMTKIAQAAGLGRESLYKSLSRGGNPRLATILRVIDALGLRLHAAPARKLDSPRVMGGARPDRRARRG